MFDTIDHNILLNRLENFVDISGSALAWFKSYLSDHHQFVAVNEEVSYRSKGQYGVPQGSVQGPLLFTLYMLPLGDIIRKHGVSFHCYADDIQLYISSQPGETYRFAKLTKCIVDIKKWMTTNFSLLHSEKTEVLIIRPKTSTCDNLEQCLALDGCSVNSSSSVRNHHFQIVFLHSNDFFCQLLKLHPVMTEQGVYGQLLKKLIQICLHFRHTFFYVLQLLLSILPRIDFVGFSCFIKYPSDIKITH